MLFLLYQHGGVSRYALLTTSKPKSLGGGGFDGDIVLIGLHDLCQTGFHGRHMRIDFGPFGADGSVYVSEAIAFCGDEFDGFAQQYLAIHVQRVGRRVGEVVANVAHVGSAEQRIADGMNQHIGVAVAEQTQCVVYLYAAQP